MARGLELSELRHAALEIFARALKSVDVSDALRRAVHLDGSRLTINDTTYSLEASAEKAHYKNIYVVAVGKAALNMSLAVNEILDDRLTAGVLACPSSIEADVEALTKQLIAVGQISEHERDTENFRHTIRKAVEQSKAHTSPLSLKLSSLSRWQVFEGGHPLSNEASLAAAHAAIELTKRAERERALLLFLISGGGSALMEWPRDERITLEDLRRANRALTTCGATIAEINAVRRAFSSVKGGRLSRLAPHADQISLLVSDTNPGEESAVASGPTFDPPENAPDAHEVVSRYSLSLPSSVVKAMELEEAAPVRTPHEALRDFHLLLDNQAAIEAAARAAASRGFTVLAARDLVEQPIEEGCAELVSRLYARGSSKREDEVLSLISGGEFACPVAGNGTGGRNSETALRCAIAFDSYHEQTGKDASSVHAVVLSAGTDGVDGNSPAAGAIADETTVRRAIASGLDPHDFLERSDSYAFFDALKDAIVTGPTGTNVRDLRIMLLG